MKRREFLNQFGLFSSGLILNRFLPLSLLGSSTSFALDTKSQRDADVLVFIFARGAMDGLSLLVPFSDGNYQTLRPHIGLKAGGELPILKIDSQFGLHPAFASLLPLWKENLLAFVPQSGSANPTRSHFDAQDFMESGAPGIKNINDGFLNRALALASRTAGAGADANAIHAIALQSNMPRALNGSFPALSMNSIRDFNIKQNGSTVHLSAEASAEGFEKMYEQAADLVFRGIGHEVSGAIASVQKALPIAKATKESELYPKNGFADRMREIASLIKAEIGVKVAVTEHNGFDTHVYQGAGHGQLADRLREFSDAMAAFQTDLGQKFSNVTVVMITEFGRTVRENGTSGTDHGHGSVMTLLGGRVRGGIHGQWQDLAAAHLFENRDVPVNTDFRTVLSEVLQKTLHVTGTSGIFPGFNFNLPMNVMRS